MLDTAVACAEREAHLSLTWFACAAQRILPLTPTLSPVGEREEVTQLRLYIVITQAPPRPRLC